MFLESAKKNARNANLRLHAFLKCYQKKVWIFGNARSGTTWVSSMINHQGKFRELFEPFHPLRVEASSFLKPHYYLRGSDYDQHLCDFAKRVFSGNLLHPNVDLGTPRWRFHGLLSKDIYANLFSYSICQRMPEIQPILLIRNPFSVVLSMERAGWFDHPAQNLKAVVSQKKLIEDHLEPFLELIDEIRYDDNPLTKQILLWAIINYVPLRQFEKGSLYLCSYEELIEEPIEQANKLMAFIYSTGGHADLSRLKSVISRPSRVASSDFTKKRQEEPLDVMLKNGNKAVIDRGLQILDRFGFSGLYPNGKTFCRREIGSFSD